MAESIAYLSPFPTLPNGQLTLSLDLENLSNSLTQSSPDSFVVDLDASPFEVILKSEIDSESKALDWLDIESDNSEGIEPAIELLNRNVGLCLVASSPASRFRRLQIQEFTDEAEVTSIALDELQNGRTFRFDPQDYRGALRIKAYLVYKEGHEFEYLRCGESNELTLYFSDHETLPGSDIDVKWRFFTEDFPDHQDQYFRLTYKTDGTPILWLNKSFEKFHYIMSLRTNSGKQAVIRETMNHRIASQLWHLVLAEALTTIASISIEDLDTYEAEDLTSSLSGFQISVLKEFLSFLQIGDDFQTGLRELIHYAVDRSLWLAEKSSDFVQDKCLAAEPFSKLNRTFLEG